MYVYILIMYTCTLLVFCTPTCTWITELVWACPSLSLFQYSTLLTTSSTNK